MGVYGIDVYSQTRFGRDPTLVRPDFSVDPFDALAVDYSTLHLTWLRPYATNAADPGQNDCTYLRLIRNSHNLPQDEDDGLYLWGDQNPVLNPDGSIAVPAFSDSVQRAASFTDSGLGGGFQYYTMWGWSQTDSIWVRCSDLIALVPLNWGYGYRLYNLLPMAYRDSDIILVDPYNPWPEDNPNPPLQRFMNLLGFQMDFIRTELESLTSINDPMNCSGALLPLLAQQFGLTNEPAIGMQQERVLISNAIHLYKLKGSPRGISEFASILTSYPMATLAHHGYNCLLSRDDSVGEDAIGTWQTWPTALSHFPAVPQATGITITQVPNLLSVPTTNPISETPGGPPYPGGLPTGLTPQYNMTGIRIGATGAGDRYITTGRVPITDFMSTTYGQGFLTWKIQIWSSVARQVHLSVWGDVGNGVPVQVAPETNFTETAGHWTVMTIAAPVNPYPNGPTSQAAYYWLYPRIRIIGAGANENHYITLMGLWTCPPGDIGINTPIYDYPRDVKVTLSPMDENLLSNPLTEFDQGFDGITPAVDPTQSSVNFTCGLTIHYTSAEDPPGVFTPLSGGNSQSDGALQVAANSPNATVWFGLVNAFTSPAPTAPQGWFTQAIYTGWPSSGDGGDWFPNEVLTAAANPWMDPVDGDWFFGPDQVTLTSGYYFTVSAPTDEGNWFPSAQQPPLNGNLGPFTVPPGQAPGQPFNFSVYADYLTAVDPSNAAIQIGFRWYYPDGTWHEVYTQYQLTNTLTRYGIPVIGDSTLANLALANPYPEPITYAQPTTMYPFVRFPNSQAAQYVLNSGMLSLGSSVGPYFDISMFPGNSDYVWDSHHAVYYYKNRDLRNMRLETVLYKWIPMGASHTEIFGAGGAIPPLDPTLWTHPSMGLMGNTTLSVTAANTTPGVVTLGATAGLTATPS